MLKNYEKKEVNNNRIGKRGGKKQLHPNNQGGKGCILKEEHSSGKDEDSALKYTEVGKKEEREESVSSLEYGMKK